MFKLVVFDWDGTLADSVNCIIRCKQYVARYFNLPVPSHETIKQALGMGFESAMLHCFPAVEPEHLNDVAKKFRQLMLEPEYVAKLFPGAFELLFSLKKRSVRLGIATSKSQHELECALKLHNLTDCFDAICCGERYKDKPDPLILQHMMELFNVPTSQVLMVGDTVTDIQFARNAQVSVFAVTHGAHSQQQLQTANPDAIFVNLLSAGQRITKNIM